MTAGQPRRRRVLALVPLLFPLCAASSDANQSPAASPEEKPLNFETVTLDDREPAATVQILSRPADLQRRPVILMLGALNPDGPPDWSTGLLAEGYMLVAFNVHYPPDPDPARRSQWLFFDQRFAHGYVLGGARAPGDAGRVIDYLVARDDVHPDKIGWLGSSSTGIPGLAVAAREPRLAAIVAFVSTGAYRLWLQSWHSNGLWQGRTPDLWPETEKLLATDDPILHVSTMYPTAVLMVSGGDDKVVDPATASAFADAARPYYEADPGRLRLVVYDGFAHNLPIDVVRMYAEHWFHLYMHPTEEPPVPPPAPTSLRDSVVGTQINAADHRDIVGAAEGEEP